MEFNNEELIEQLNRLLEQLHQVGLDRRWNLHIHLEASPLPSPKGKGVYPAPQRRGELLPEVLRTEEAMRLWGKVREAGLVDEDFQPTISRTQAALLAFEMARRLGIKEKWKVFEDLWKRKNMYKDYYNALNQKSH